MNRVPFNATKNLLLLMERTFCNFISVLLTAYHEVKGVGIPFETQSNLAWSP